MPVLESLRKYKLLAFLLACFLAAIAIFAFQAKFWPPDALSELRSVVHAIAEAIIVAVVVGLTYEFVVRLDSENVLFRKIRDEMTAHINRSALNASRHTAGVLLNARSLIDVLSDESLHHLVQLGLRKLSRNPEMADGVYSIVSDTMAQAQEPWFSLSHIVELGPVARSDWVTAAPANVFLELTDRMTYETTFHKEHYEFVCCYTAQQYEKHERRAGADSIWKVPGLSIVADNPGRSVCFEVSEFMINGKNVPSSYTIDCDGSQRMLFEIPHDLRGVRCRISFVVATVVRREARYYRIRLNAPTKGLRVRVDSRPGLTTRLKIHQFFPKYVMPHQQAPGTGQWVEVSTDDWLLAGHGVIIVWE